MAGAILVLNAGSSSLKFSVFLESEPLTPLVHGEFDQLATRPQFAARNAAGITLDSHTWPEGVTLSPGEAARLLFADGLDHLLTGHRLRAAGHRVVHGGSDFARPVRIDEAVLHRLGALVPLAPLHQPHNIAVIRETARHAPQLPQVACFDTSFHRTQPKTARTIALPAALRNAGIERYGFHGLSYEYIARALPPLDAGAAAGRTVVAHLGNGASLCALAGGRSVATTMGFSTLDGLIMGTRCGGIDPGALLYLIDHCGFDARRLEHVLYHESGLLGVSEISSDMRTLLASDAHAAAAAVELFVYRVVREIGSLAAALHGLDALVFTGGIGEHAAPVRARVCQELAWLGLEFDAVANAGGYGQISRPSSRISAWVVPTNEELMIATHTRDLLGPSGA